ncbi:hypothetical protein KY342_00035, partial [Candidatus Woesearchaeota archaeon]|nr:hypothetical protein [Candidatus Woesearchaeota archaeon]
MASKYLINKIGKYNDNYYVKDYNLESIVYDSFYTKSGKGKKLSYGDLYRDFENLVPSEPTFTPDQTKAIEETAKKLGLDP